MKKGKKLISAVLCTATISYAMLLTPIAACAEYSCIFQDSNCKVICISNTANCTDKLSPQSISNNCCLLFNQNCNTVPSSEENSINDVENPTDIPYTNNDNNDDTAPHEAATEPTVPQNTENDDNAASSYIDEVVRLTNIEREKSGLNQLVKRDDMCGVANIRAMEISQTFSHTRPNGQDCFSVVKEKNISYRFLGENIASGYTSPEAVVKGWMNSEGHKANVLNGNFSGIGIGYYEHNGIKYWVQMFIG